MTGMPTHEGRIIVSFSDGDPENPYNWRWVRTFATNYSEKD